MLKKSNDDDRESTRDPHAVAVGRRLAVARKAAGLTQAELARRLKVSASKLSNWENGINFLPGPYVAKIFLITRIDSNWLFLNDPDKLPANVYRKLFPESAPKSRRTDSGS